MTDSAIVNGEFVTFSHIKTRKTFAITIEFPEELALHVLNTLGAPIGQISKPVAVALLNHTDNHTADTPIITPLDKSEGDKLRVRAVLLCKDKEFWRYVAIQAPFARFVDQECNAKDLVYEKCGIASRSELTTNAEAQEKFKQLDREFNAWKVDQQYADNLSKG